MPSGVCAVTMKKYVPREIRTGCTNKQIETYDKLEHLIKHLDVPRVSDSEVFEAKSQFAKYAETFKCDNAIVTRIIKF